MTGLFRRLGRFGLRWLVLRAAVRFVGRRFGRATIERAALDLEAVARERLPAPVARAVSALPPEARTASGSAVVAGRAARGAYTATRRAGRAATIGTRRLTATVEGARAAPARFREQLRTETEASERELRARYIEASFGAAAATDSLLDVRSRSGLDRSAADHDPHVDVPPPVPVGRRRFRPRLPRAVNRVRRTYRQPAKPWDW